MSFRSARSSAGLELARLGLAVMAARFSIGVDLGTTNSALAYVPLTGDAEPEALAVSQWEGPTALVEAPTLPSFLYLPEDGRAAELPGRVPEPGDGSPAASPGAGQGKPPDALCGRQSRGCVTIRPTAPRRFCPGDRTIFSRRKRSRLSAPPR